MNDKALKLKEISPFEIESEFYNELTVHVDLSLYETYLASYEYGRINDIKIELEINNEPVYRNPPAGSVEEACKTKSNLIIHHVSVSHVEQAMIRALQKLTSGDSFSVDVSIFQLNRSNGGRETLILTMVLGEPTAISNEVDIVW